MSSTLDQQRSPSPSDHPNIASARVDSRDALTDGRRRGWAYAGLAAGVGGFALFLGPASMLTVDTEALADNAQLTAEITGKEEWAWAFQTGSVTVAVLTVIFGVGLRRRLAGQEPAGSLTPDLAAFGMLLVATMLFVGGGISTELFHSLRHADEVDPDTFGAHLALFNTMGWVWAGGILTTGAVAYAGRKHGSVGRGVTWFAVAMTVLIALTQVVPLQYLAVAPVALFLIVTSISMVRSEPVTTDRFRENDNIGRSVTPDAHFGANTSHVFKLDSR